MECSVDAPIDPQINLPTSPSAPITSAASRRRPGRPPRKVHSQILNTAIQIPNTSHAEASNTGPPKRRPGRPKGSVNKQALTTRYANLRKKQAELKYASTRSLRSS